MANRSGNACAVDRSIWGANLNKGFATGKKAHTVGRRASSRASQGLTQAGGLYPYCPYGARGQLEVRGSQEKEIELWQDHPMPRSAIRQLGRCRRDLTERFNGNRFELNPHVIMNMMRSWQPSEFLMALRPAPGLSVEILRQVLDL
jgi:hypothetical protein